MSVIGWPGYTAKRIGVYVTEMRRRYEVFHHQSDAFEIMQVVPYLNCFSGKPAVRETDDKPAAGPQYSGDFIE